MVTKGRSAGSRDVIAIKLRQAKLAKLSFAGLVLVHRQLQARIRRVFGRFAS